MVNPEHYKELDALSFREVAEAWRRREQGIWDEHIRQHGYGDWDGFRFGPNGTLCRYGFAPLLQDLRWKQYEVLHPHDAVPNILAGPFKGWAIHNPKRNEDGSGVREALPFQTIVKRFGSIFLIKKSGV